MFPPSLWCELKPLSECFIAAQLCGKWPRGGTGAFVTSFCVTVVRNDLLTGFALTLGFSLEETLWV